MSQAAAKFVALYKEPANREDFDKQYFGQHVPLVEKVPGLRGIEIVRLTKNLMGGETPYYMMATLTFENKDALKAAMGSPEMKAAGDNLMSFASEVVTMCFGETADASGVSTLVNG